MIFLCRISYRNNPYNGKFSMLLYDFFHTNAIVWKISNRKRKISIYVYGTFKSMEEKPYLRMRYLRLFFTV